MSPHRSQTTLAGLLVAVTTCCAVAASWRNGAFDENLILVQVATAFVAALICPRPFLSGLGAGLIAVVVVSALDQALIGSERLTAARASIARLPTAMMVLLLPIFLAAWLGSIVRVWLSQRPDKRLEITKMDDNPYTAPMTKDEPISGWRWIRRGKEPPATAH